MLISELIERLEVIKSINGDLPVYDFVAGNLRPSPKDLGNVEYLKKLQGRERTLRIWHSFDDESLKSDKFLLI